MMQRRVPDMIQSPQDLDALITELQEYAAWYAHNDIKQRVGAKTATPPPQLSPAALEAIQHTSGAKLLTHQMLTKLIDDLELSHKNASIVSVTLAAPAPNDLRQKLVIQCRNHIAKNALVTFKINRSILGGMVLVYGSHVYDWSFRKRIIEQKDIFPEVLKRV